jgi:CorA-like Mg2+ transporter protein
MGLKTSPEESTARTSGSQPPVELYRPFTEYVYRPTPPAWTSTPKILEHFSLPSKVEAKIGAGSGQLDTPFSINQAEFDNICREFSFARSLLRKISAKKPCFEHHFTYDESDDSKTPTHLDIGLATYEIDSFFMLLRYDIRSDSVKSLIFVKERDYLKYESISPGHLLKHFQDYSDLLRRYPLMLLNITLQFMQFGVHEFVRWRIAINEMESILGVTRYGSLLEKCGYESMSHQYGLLNAELVGLSKKRADSERSASTILAHAKSFYRLVAICEDFQAEENALASNRTPVKRVTTCQREEVQSTITRAELYLKDTKSTEDIIRSLNEAFANRISRRESNATKTLAALGLIFIPAAFVSQVVQVFSTGIFTSQTPDGSGHHLSKYGWLYIWLSVLLTIVTMIIWICWNRWGSSWLEALRIDRIRGSRKISPDGLYIKMANSRRGLSTDINSIA